MTAPGPPDQSRTQRRRRINGAFTVLCWGVAMVSVVVLGILLLAIGTQGVEHLNLDLLRDPPSRDAHSAGLGPAIWGSIWICVVCALVALPLGVGTAIFLEEYKPGNKLLRRAHGIVQLNIANLAGVPSIVYGILGLTAFVQMFNLFGNANDPTSTFGQRWYDYVVDAAGEPYYVRVAGEDAASIDLTLPHTFETEDGDVADVALVDAIELQSRVDAALALSDPVTNAIREGLGDEAMTTSDVRSVIAASLEGTELSLEPSLVDNMAAALAEASAESGRDRRRGIRSALNLLNTTVLTEHVAGQIPVDAVPTRIDRKAWYYVQLPFGRGVLAGGLTLMLVVLPIVIVSSQEALRSVPPSLREGALGMGATKWQMIWRMILPASVPGIMTGAILAMSRAIGEAAPILILAGIVYITFTPTHLMDDFTAMPLQIYDWASRPQEEFHRVAASGIIVLLAVLLTFNAAAVFIRQKFQKPMQ